MILALYPGDPQYDISYVLTLIIIVVKFALALFLLRNFSIRNKQSEGTKLDFLFAMFLLIFGLAVSRVLFFYFDYYLTHFDPELFYVSPNVWYWKAAGVATFVTGAFLLYVLDKKVLNNKFKGGFAVLVLTLGIIQTLYPVQNANDFQKMSTIGTLTGLVSVMVPLIFFDLGRKSSGKLRKISFLFGISILCYALTSMLMAEQILNAIELAAGMQGRLAVIIIVPIAKIVFLVLLTYSTINFQI